MSNLVIGGNCYRPSIPKRSSKVVVFEGPDGVGKTTIAQGLSLSQKIPYFRMQTQHENWRKNRFKEALEFDQTYVASFLRQTKHSVVIDRAFPSEWVYSRVFGRETNEEVLKEVDLSFARMGAFIVICLRDDYSKNQKDELVDHTMLTRLHTEYLNFVEWTRCSTIVIYTDSFSNDLQKQMSVLEPELKWDSELRFSVKVELRHRKAITVDNEDIFSEPGNERKVLGFERIG